MNPSKIINFYELVYKQNDLTSNMKRCLENYIYANWNDAFSNGQIKSKLWLIDELENFVDFNSTSEKLIYVCAGWYGILPALLFDKWNNLKIRSFDIDSECTRISEEMNRSYVKNGWKFKSTTYDIVDMTYPFVYKTLKYNGEKVELNEDPDIIINTSCEHIEYFETWFENLPKNKVIALQSNNFVHSEHINMVNSLEEFKSQTNFSEILYSGELNISEVDYTRYMLIGIK